MVGGGATALNREIDDTTSDWSACTGAARMVATSGRWASFRERLLTSVPACGAATNWPLGWASLVMRTTAGSAGMVGSTRSAAALAAPARSADNRTRASRDSRAKRDAWRTLQRARTRARASPAGRQLDHLTGGIRRNRRPQPDRNARNFTLNSLSFKGRLPFVEC